MNKFLYALLGLWMIPQITVAQEEIIYLEDFSTVAPGTGFPASPLNTTVEIGAGFASMNTASLRPRFGRFNVNGSADRLESYSIQGGEVIWETTEIDISCFANIQVEVELSGTGSLDDGNGGGSLDYAAVDLIIVDDNTPFPELFYKAGGIPSNEQIFSTVSPILNTCFGQPPAQKIKLRIRLSSSANFEGHNIHYVKVTGESAIPTNVTYSVNCDEGIDLQLGADAFCAAEFSLDNVTYNTTGLFQDLTANTDYTIYVRDQFLNFEKCTTTVNVFVTDCDVVLPIELVNFRGRTQGENILLEWTTASELNNDFMAVEHRTDGTDFREIGRIRGAGTTQEPQHYHFLDRNALPGTNYYRLRQVDLDGAYTYHQVIAVEWAERGTANGNLHIYPTVAREVIRVELGFKPEKSIPYHIYSLLGQSVRSGEISPQTDRLELQLLDLPAGSYIFSTQYGGVTHSARFFSIQE